MSELNPNQSDLVLGGQNPPPLDAAILGGLAGAKQDPNISSLRSLIVELDFLFLYHWIRDEHLIADLMYPILMNNITPALKSLGINYKCDEYPRPRIADEVKQKAMHGTFELVFNSLAARQNLKYLSVQMPTSQMSEYLTTEKIDNLKNSVPYKSFAIVKNMRVNFG